MQFKALISFAVTLKIARLPSIIKRFKNNKLPGSPHLRLGVSFFLARPFFSCLGFSPRFDLFLPSSFFLCLSPDPDAL